MIKLLRLGAILFLAFAPACSRPPVLPPEPTPTRAPVTPSPPGLEKPPEASPTHTPGGPITLRIWLPPQFDPAQDTRAGTLLRRRLMEFTQQRPRVQLDVRVKAPAGPGGMLDALTTAGAAAPQALPDLAALPRDVLEAAALKGLLYPYNPAGLAVDEQDWFPFARDLAYLQESLYGAPFAGDALAMVYRPLEVGEAPVRWSQIISGTQTLVFPAADPQALFTLAWYQARGGKIQDEAGRPLIESLALTEVLTYFAKAEVSGVMHSGLTQYQSDQQVWTAFIEGQAQMAGAWCSRYLGNAGLVADDNILLAPLPTSDGKLFTLATGWAWALASKDGERQRVAVELANFLTESAFLADWSEAAGYLPPYRGALQDWSNAESRRVLDRIARTAQMMPSADLLSALSSPLWQATNDVLKGQNDPLAAAQEAAAALAAP